VYNAETGAPERRRTPRVRVADGAQAIVAASGSVRVLDISAGGVLLASTRPALVGTRGRLSLTVAGNPWAATVEICRIVPSADRVGYRIGASFVDISPAQRDAIERFARQ